MAVAERPATILQVPNELLLPIFQECAGRHSLDALALSHVCCRWRCASIGMGELWSSIGVHRHENPNSVGVKQLTALYLERSGSYPLDIFLDVPSPALVHFLADESTRWMFLHVRTTQLFFRQLLDPRFPRPLHRIRGNLPLLQHLVIEYDRVENEWDYNVRFDVCELAPSLHTLEVDTSSLTVTNLPSFGRHPNLVFSLETIRHIALKALDSNEARYILASYPNLQTARFSTLTILDPGVVEAANRATVPSLDLLSITLDDSIGGDIEQLLHGLFFSALTVFELSSPYPMRKIPAFLQNSGQTLRRLRLAGLTSRAPSSMLLGLLRSCAMIEVLDLRGIPRKSIYLSSALIRSLAFQQDGKVGSEGLETLVPRLRVLRTYVPHIPWNNPRAALQAEQKALLQEYKEALVSMIVSRRQQRVPEGAVCLESVDLGRQWMEAYDELPDSLKVLQRLRSEGLVIE